jgi:hypothetical protein
MICTSFRKTIEYSKTNQVYSFKSIKIIFFFLIQYFTKMKKLEEYLDTDVTTGNSFVHSSAKNMHTSICAIMLIVIITRPFTFAVHRSIDTITMLSSGLEGGLS